VRSWGLSVQEQEELWRRWRQGESLRLLARRMGKRCPSVRAFVLQTGGVKQPLHRSNKSAQLAQLLGSSHRPWMKTTGVVPEAFAAWISLLSRSEMDAMADSSRPQWKVIEP
jgi:hypothetical protein